MRKKAVDARHLIQCFKEHSKFDKIHLNLKVFSFHPLRFDLKIKVKEFQETEREEELTKENVLPAPLTSSPQTAGDNGGRKEVRNTFLENYDLERGNNEWEDNDSEWEDISDSEDESSVLDESSEWEDENGDLGDVSSELDDSDE